MSTEADRGADDARAPAGERPVLVSVEGGDLAGTLTLPAGTNGVVAFAHGSGSSRHSPRNQLVADALVSAGLGTLLIDLLTPAEEAADLVDGRLRFDIPLLSDRVVAALDWLAAQGDTAALKAGVFGASTGAAAALVAAAARPEQAGAVVSRGGRPDLAGDALRAVRAPTLLIVDGLDPQVLELNREALHALDPDARLEVVPGATHLFEEPGALARVAQLAARWFVQHLEAAGRAG